MLKDSSYPTYALTNSNLAEAGIQSKKTGITYLILEKGSGDPRAGIALDEMLGKYVW